MVKKRRSGVERDSGFTGVRVEGHCASITHVPLSLGRPTEEYGLSDRQSTDASDRAVDSRVVLVRTNNGLQHVWRKTC